MRASTDPERDKKAKEELGYSLGMQAYLYGLPSLRLEEFRAGINRLATIAQKLGMNYFSESTTDGVQFNELGHVRILSTPELKVGITPNNDTMYSSAYYDLAQEPLVMTVPDIADRYYSVQIVDAYLSNAAYIGTRATQSKPGNYLLAGPDWQGEVPAGMELIRLPTNEGFLAVRILVDDPDDADNVIALQNQFDLVPLSARLGQTVVARLPAIPEPRLEGELHHYRRIVEIAQRNPPRDVRTKAIWQSFEHIGLSLDKPFDPAAIDPAIKKGMQRAIESTADVIAWKVKYRGYKSQSMWNVDTRGGSYEQDYLARAEGAIQGLVVHDSEEGMYFHTYHDGDGALLNGSQAYQLNFDADHLPPVNAFWSLTGYTSDYNLVENPIQRYSIGDRTEGLKYNEDGSLTLYIQSTPPAEGISNWLPTPAGEMFRLNLRMYMPKPVMREKSKLEAYLPPVAKHV